jgi:hypothetical protein
MKSAFRRVLESPRFHLKEADMIRSAKMIGLTVGLWVVGLMLLALNLNAAEGTTRLLDSTELGTAKGGAPLPPCTQGLLGGPCTDYIGVCALYTDSSLGKTTLPPRLVRIMKYETPRNSS